MRRRLCISTPAAAATWLVLCCSARFMLRAFGQAPEPAAETAIPARGGIGPFLESRPEYSLFYSFMSHDYFASHALARYWSQGPTNNTFLVPSNSAVEEGFNALAQDYGIASSSTKTVAQRILDFESDNRAAASAKDAVLEAFIYSHNVLAPFDFYHNSTILAATYDIPSLLPHDFGLLNSLAAYTENMQGGPLSPQQDVIVRQAGGLLNNETGIPIPPDPIKEVGTNTYDGKTGGVQTLYIYGPFGSIFVAGQTIEYGLTSRAFKTLAEYLPA